MRKLMWFSIGFSVICALCAYGRNQMWILPAAMAMVAGGLVFLYCSKKKGILFPAIAILAGCVAGIVWFAAFDWFWLYPLRPLDGTQVTLRVTASDYGYETEYGSALDGVTSIGGKPYQIRVYLDEQMPLSPGDQVSGTFRLRFTGAGEDNNTWFQGKGIFLCGYQRGAISTVRVAHVPLWCRPAVLRHNLLQVLDSLFPSDTAPFAKALLLGDSRSLDYATDTALKISGIRHVVAVSGLHISMLYGVLSVLTMRRRYLTALVGIPTVLLFAAVAGLTPSVLRAAMMVCLMMLAAVFEREYDALTALSFAVLVMLLANPLAATSVSLQLSAGCVAGILLFQGRIQAWLKGSLPKGKGLFDKIRSMLCGSVSVTAGAAGLVTPLSACYFGTVSLVSPLTNLLTLWIVGLVFNGLILTCLLYVLSPGLAALLAAFLSWPIRYVLAVSDFLASLPLAAVYTQSIPVVHWLIFTYGLLMAFWKMEKKRPAVFFGCTALGLCLALTVSWLKPLAAGTTITMLDVGQGQSIVLQSQGRTFLVDCGGDSDEETADLIAETLLSQGISRLDGIILTHYDRDHASAIHPLLTRLDTDLLFLPDTQREVDLPVITGETVFVWEDLELTFGTAALRIYGPVYSGLDNENSLCVLFDTEKCDILITGDRSAFGERMLLRRANLPQVDVLVAGHHGADDATSSALLHQVKPDTVLISAGRDNVYGHPSQALLQRLVNMGCTVFRTDLNGTIIIRR